MKPINKNEVFDYVLAKINYYNASSFSDSEEICKNYIDVLEEDMSSEDLVAGQIIFDTCLEYKNENEQRPLFKMIEEIIDIYANE